MRGRKDGTKEQGLSQEFVALPGNQIHSPRSEERLEWIRSVGNGEKWQRKAREVESKLTAAAGLAPRGPFGKLNDENKNSA